MYEPLDLPFPNYLATSRGLLIPQVTTDMSGTSFRCYYPSGNGLEVVASTIGFLHVEARRKCYNINLLISALAKLIFSLAGNYSINFLDVFLFNSLDIDHQKLNFGLQNKTFAWRPSVGGSFEMIGRSGCCRESSTLRRWPDINDTEITITNAELEYNSSLLNFDIFNDVVRLKKSFQVDASGKTE